MARPPITRANPYTPQRGAHAGITFTSERQYRNALAREKGFRNLYQQQQAPPPKPQRGEPPRPSHPAAGQARTRALDALRFLRSGKTLTQATKDAKTTPNAIKRYAGSALTKAPSGRVSAKPSDRLERMLNVPTAAGPVPLPVRDSRTATRLGRYWNAVQDYLETGSSAGLRSFRSKGVTIQKHYYPLITDPTTLDRLADGGLLHFSDLYTWQRAA